MSVGTDGNQFRVLVVCTANIARSPFVERLLTHRLAAHLGADVAGMTVTSAGVRARAGRAMDPPMAELLERHGADAGGFRARRLTEEQLREADLVLTATREHRGAVVTLLPAALRRTFTLHELARLGQAVQHGLLPGDPSGRLCGLVAVAATMRGVAVPQKPEDDDVADPHGGPPLRYQEAAAAMSEAVDRLVAIL